MFRKIVKKILLKSNHQRGQVILFALIYLLFVSVIVGALLTFMSSALKQGTALEYRTNQTYIADSGVESACQKILSGDLDGIMNVGDTYPYTLNNPNGTGSRVDITITSEIPMINQGQTYRVTSIGTDAGGKSTKVTADINSLIGPYSGFLNNIASSNGTVDTVSMSGHVTIDGTVQAAGVTGNPTFGSGGWNGPYTGEWPKANELRSFYKSENPPPQYHNSGWSASGTLTSNQYVVGTCNIGGDLYLNGYTLFVDGIVTTSPHVYIYGAGVVAATGDIETWPGDNTDPNSGVFFFSLGTVSFHPSAHFYGWIAGYNGIDFKQGNAPTFEWVQPNPYIYQLDFPNLIPTGPGSPGGAVSITDWKVTIQ